MGKLVKVGALLAMATILAILPPAVLANAQAGCSFKLGFKTLHDQISEVVGNCKEDEHFETSTGNSLQATTGGLMVWRKADNWTVFTDGSTTWLNGPAGIVSRPNAGPMFDWESKVPVAVAAPAGGGSVQDYLLYMTPRLRNITDTLNKINEHFSLASGNSTLLTDPTWRAKTRSLLAELRSGGLELQAYSPVPPEVADLDATLKSVGQDYVYAADETTAGLDTGDSNRITNAAIRLSGVSAKLNTATAQLQALAGQPITPAVSPAPPPPPAPEPPPHHRLRHQPPRLHHRRRQASTRPTTSTRATPTTAATLLTKLRPKPYYVQHRATRIGSTPIGMASRVSRIRHRRIHNGCHADAPPSRPHRRHPRRQL
jgi:hypothetical protein